MTCRAAATILVVAGFAAACGDDDPVSCDDSSSCVQAGIHGTCRPSPSSSASFCSFPDNSCPAPPAERWGVLAGDGLARADFGDFGGVATSSGGDDVFVFRHPLP